MHLILVNCSSKTAFSYLYVYVDSMYTHIIWLCNHALWKEYEKIKKKKENLYKFKLQHFGNSMFPFLSKPCLCSFMKGTVILA